MKILALTPYHGVLSAWTQLRHSTTTFSHHSSQMTQRKWRQWVILQLSKRCSRYPKRSGSSLQSQFSCFPNHLNSQVIPCTRFGSVSPALAAPAGLTMTAPPPACRVVRHQRLLLLEHPSLEQLPQAVDLFWPLPDFPAFKGWGDQLTACLLDVGALPPEYPPRVNQRETTVVSCLCLHSITKRGEERGTGANRSFFRSRVGR